MTSSLDRESRNKSEKNRREQFNVLLRELGAMLPGATQPGATQPGHSRKMDKSTVLQKSIDFLHRHQEIAAQSESSEVRPDWKPPFLSNQEFTQLMMEALDGFFVALQPDGNILYASDGVAPLLEHLPADLVDQNLLDFLPAGEHAAVAAALCSHATEGGAPPYPAAKQLEFCCHVLRGGADPREPPVYEQVRVIGNFKALSNVKSSRAGLDAATRRSLPSGGGVCLVATVKLAKPQFIKEMCTVEEPHEEFTSRHSLEWKFLFLDHRAPPLIGYLPFEVLGTSGYDYYHVDDLEALARGHEHLMQCGKGTSCYYRFLTKGQQWIWLQTHHYITYHQWTSRPEFIVCTHTVVSYADVRAERRRALGVDVSQPEVTADMQSQDSGSESRLNTSTLKEALERFNHSRTPSASSSSLTAVSDAASAQKKFRVVGTPRRHSTSGVEMASQRRSSFSSQKSMSSQTTGQNMAPSMFSQQQQQQQQVQISSQSSVRFSGQLEVMHNLKQQLEQRTRLIEANIQRQQDQLRLIQDQLQRVPGQGLQTFGGPGCVVQQGGGALGMQGQLVSAGPPLYSGVQQQQRTLLWDQSAAAPPPSLYNAVMIPQQGPANVVQIASADPNAFAQDRSPHMRFPASPQLLTKLVAGGQVACGAVMVPSTMFMGQVVTAFGPQQGATQTISISQQPLQQQQQEQQQQQFLQAPRLLHGNQSTQLILQAAFPLQQQFQQQQQQHQQQHQQQQHLYQQHHLSDRSAPL